MITLSTLSIFVAITLQSMEVPSWYCKLVEHHDAPYIHRNNAPLITNQSAPKQRFDGRVNTDPKYIESLKREDMLATEYGRRRKENGVRAGLNFLESLPTRGLVLTSFMANDYLELGDYRNALQSLTASVAMGQDPDEMFYMKVAIASGELGEVYEGEIEYCEAAFQLIAKDGNLTSEYPRDSREIAKNFPPAKRAIILGSLARAACDSLPDSLRVLELDPYNKTATLKALELYEFAGRKPEVLALSQRMAAHLPPGKDHDFYLEQIKWAKK